MLTAVPVTESKLALPAAGQANESKRREAEARETLQSGQLADQEDGKLAPQNNHLWGLDARFFSISEMGEGRSKVKGH